MTDIIEQVVFEIRTGLNHLNGNSYFKKTMSFLYNEDYKDYLLAFLTNRYLFFKCLNGVAFSNNEINNIKCAKCLEDSTFTEKSQDYKDEL